VFRVRRLVVVLLALVAVAVLAAGAALWGFSTGWLQVNRPSRTEFPVRGIDVSNHQGPIDWARVRGAGYSFAYVKATEGGDFVDARFRENTAGARAAGLQVGAYHYFTFCRPGAEQARNLIDVAGPLRHPEDLPPVVDLEFGGNCSHTPTPAELDTEFGAFDAAVRQAFGVPPVLYLSEDFLHRYVDGAAARGSAFAAHRLWIRKIVGRPAGGCARWSFWQFANRGRVAGVTGPVDLDAACPGAAAPARGSG